MSGLPLDKKTVVAVLVIVVIVVMGLALGGLEFILWQLGV